MTLKNAYTGTVLQIYDNRYGKPYSSSDWRSEYVGKDGLFLYYASDTAPGKGYVFFFTARPSGKYLRTARGVVDINDSLFSDMEIEYLIRNAELYFGSKIR